MNHLHKIFISLTLIISTLFLNAQNDDKSENSIVKHESYLTFDLFSSLNVFSPKWRVGYVKTINPKWKIGLNMGYGAKNISYTYFLDHFEKDYKLWELRPEIYKVFKRNEKTVKYFSIELFYINHKDILHNSFYYPKNGGEISYDQVDYQRYKYGFNFNAGEFIKINNSYRINIFAGLGLRFRSVMFTNIVNSRPSNTFVDMFDFYEFREKEGLDLGLSYSLGVKLIM